MLDGISSLAGEFAVLKDGLAVIGSQNFRSEKLRALVEAIGPDAVSHLSALQRLLGACEQRRKDVLYQFSFFSASARNWRSQSSVGEADLASTCCDG